MSAPVFGFGPLEALLADDDVNELFLNGGGELWVERRGGGPPVAAGRLAPDMIEAVVERMLAPIGRRLDRSSPVVDARLPDGSRLCAVLAPVAVDGLCLAVRRFTTEQIPIDHWGNAAVVALLRQVITERCNVLVSGATSAGKTTLLNSLASTIDVGERVITLEDTAELRLPLPHVVRLETRPATPDGLPAVELDQLLRAALRLRPDRLVVGEIRGAEAVDLVQALNTGHDGSLATVHANTPAEALARIESLVVRDHAAWSLTAVRTQVRCSIDVVMQVARDASGRRSVRQVAEVLTADDGAAVRLLADGGRVVGQLTRGRSRS